MQMLHKHAPSISSSNTTCGCAGGQECGRAEAQETCDRGYAPRRDHLMRERILKEAKDWAENTKERLRADITEWQDMATKIEAVLWEEILLARSSAVAELEVWKHGATKAQA